MTELINQYIVKAASDPDIFNQVLKATKSHIFYVQRLGVHFTNSELKEEVNSSIIHGVRRAWLYRFLLEKLHVQPKDFFMLRRNKLEDFETVSISYPEFKTWAPKTRLTTDELIAAAKEEFSTSLFGKGTDWHQNKLYSTYKVEQCNDYKSKQVGNMYDTLLDYKEIPSKPEAFSIDKECFGPVVMKIANYLLPIYGLEATTYWILSRYVYNNEYMSVFRNLGFETDKSDSIRVDLRRRLLQMDETVKELRNDTDLQNYYEAI